MQQLTQKSRLHFLLSRTDNIGDVILTLPMAYLLKQHFPDCRIIFLARDYVKAIVEACPAVNDFLSWDSLQKQTTKNAANLLETYQIDVAIHVFPRKSIAKLMTKAQIPFRIGTSHRWYHYLYCNRRVNLNRKTSTLHEAQLNLTLLELVGIDKHYTLTALKQLVKLLPIDTPLPDKVHVLIDKKRFNLIIHPLSNNNGKEWPLAYYQSLILSLPADQFNIFITGAPHEFQALQPLIDACPHAHSVCGLLSLNELITFMERCDGLIAGSTGPLHIAAALGIRTLGLYPPAQTMNPIRWAPLGAHADYLVADSACKKSCLMPEGRTCACMKMIAVKQVKNIILSWKKS